MDKRDTTDISALTLIILICAIITLLFVSVSCSGKSGRELAVERWEDLPAQGRSQICLALDIFGPESIPGMMEIEYGKELTEKKKLELKQLVVVAQEKCP